MYSLNVGMFQLFWDVTHPYINLHNVPFVKNNYYLNVFSHYYERLLLFTLSTSILFKFLKSLAV